MACRELQHVHAQKNDAYDVFVRLCAAVNEFGWLLVVDLPRAAPKLETPSPSPLSSPLLSSS